jgi:transposase-like protein
MIRPGATKMKHRKHSKEFQEHALRKAAQRGENRTLADVAKELNMSLGTLKGWLKGAGVASEGLPHGATPLSGDLPAAQWTAAQRLQALLETHALDAQALAAWCRSKGIFEHHLRAWRNGFCAGTEPTSSAKDRAALRELQGKHEQLQRELLRKEKALAETAALLVLQKKFQALLGDEA